MHGGFIVKIAAKKVCKGMLLWAITLIAILSFSINVWAASTPYEVTKSGGALIRTSYSESASSVRRAATGSIVWVVSSKKNSAGNTWYKLSDGYWIYSKNVKKHSCSWSWVSGNDPTCTASGVQNYKCNKCGQTKKSTSAAYGHNYSGNVCTRCGGWNTSSLKSKSTVNNVKYCVVSQSAKVRSGPYEKCSAVNTLYKGTDIVVTQKVVNAMGNTWYKYSGGYIFEDHVKNHSSCSWNSGTITKNATCTSTGTKVQNCTICGKSKTTTISKISHKYSGNVCTGCGCWDTSSLKSKRTIDNVKYCVVSQSAKVRSGPYEKCSAVNTLYKGTDIVITEKVVNAQGNTWYKYSGGYIFEDHVKNHSSCSWNSGTITKNATCTSTGTKVQNCIICGKSKTTTISKTGHKYSGNVCTGCGCWDTSSLKSKSTVDNVKYCVVSGSAKIRSGPYEKCGLVKALSKGTEIVVTQKVVNASGNIWYKCSDGYIFEDHVKKHSSCSWDSGKITQKATCISTGTKVQTCTLCGKTKTTTVEKTNHSYKDYVCTTCGVWKTSSLESKTKIDNVEYCVVSKSAKIRSGPYEDCSVVKKIAKGTDIVITQKVVNAKGSTWYKCSDGYIFEDHVKKHTSCSWDSGKVTKKATCTSTGTKVQECKVCEKEKITTIAKIKHHYSDNVCTGCGGWKTSSLKSKKTIDNVKYCVVSRSAKVRSGPYEKCSTVKTVSKGTDIVIIEKVVNAQGNTWYKCSDGYIFSDHVKKHSSCSWNSGTVIKKASCTSTGTKIQKCKICEKSKTVTIPAHNYEDYVCKKCGAWDTSSLKSKKSMDNVKFCVVSKNAKVHTGPYGKTETTKTLPKKTIIKVTEKVVNAGGSTWYKYSGGYIYSDYIREHIFTCGVCQSCNKVQNENDAIAKFERTKGKKTAKIAVKFSDKLFLNNSTEFSNEICRISAAGMAASYGCEDDATGFGAAFLKKCGFDHIECKNSSSEESVAEYGKNDHARYIIGWKAISGTDTILVGVLVNGYTENSYEWISNFNVGEWGLHKGFSRAANEVTQKVNEYIKMQGIDTNNMKIWITGHSRGAAVTGMTAANLNDEYGTENVFAYGFATPNGVPTTMANSVPKRISEKICTDNIFNIVNKSDFVPYVVPESWDFTKYGRTIELGVGDNTKKAYSQLAKDSYNGLSVGQRIEIISDFCAYAEDRIAYNSEKNRWGLTPSDFGEAVGLFMSEDDALLGPLVEVGLTQAGLGKKLYDNKPKITEAHCVETYLALVNAQTPSKHLKTESDCKVCNP